MKRMFAMILAAALVITMLAAFPLTASADEPTVWSGKANIKWYLDGKAQNAEEWHIKTAEDLAGLAYLANASPSYGSCYIGVYYDTNCDVLGYERTTTAQKAYADSSLCYKPTEGDGSQLTEGFNFEYQTIYLDADIVLNTGNAADWGENPPVNSWQPIGGNLPADATWAAFCGIFQGEGHTISGAYYTADPTKGLYAIGLFGCVGKKSSSQFRNLTLENSYFSGEGAVGALCGRSSGTLTVTNCYIKDCFAIGTGEGDRLQSSQQVGGMVGGLYSGGATIENCAIENISITAPRYVGGFIGDSVGQTVSVKNCYITGTITAQAVEVITAADPEAGTPETTVQKYGCEAGIIAGRAAGGAYNVENVFMAVTVNQLGKAEDQTGDNLAQAGVIYAGKGNQSNYAALAIENIYCVKNFNAEGKIAGIDDGIEGCPPLDSYDFNVVTLDALTGSAAETTLQNFDFENVWEVSETGIPQLRLAKLLEADIAAREAANQGDDEPEYKPSVRPGKITTEPSTTEEPSTTTTEPGKAKKGCRSVIVGAPAVALIALAGVMLIRKKKED